MDLYATVVGFFQQGGPFMYPIAIVLAIGLAIALERFFYLSNQTRVNRRDFQRILPLLKARKQRELADVTRQSKSAMCRIVADGLNRRSSTRRRSDIEYAMEEGLLEVLPNIERRTPYLATFANIATLLSQSISIAMNTTAFGLMVAIPLLLVHSLLQSKTSAIVESLEIAVVKFLNLMEGDEQPPAAKAQAARA